MFPLGFGYGFGGIDLIYWAILGGCMLLSMLAGGYVKLCFSRGQQTPFRSGLTGAEVARRILADQGVTDVTVQETDGFLSDHYSPWEKTHNLAPPVYGGVNAAAAGVAAHECGHALQHHLGSLSMWGRTILVYPAAFGSSIGPYMVMIGAGLWAGSHYHSHFAYILTLIGVGVFALTTLCSLIIVFNEFNASARARAVLINIGLVGANDEQDMVVRNVLIAAGLTYVAAAVGSIAQLLYWLWRSGLIGGNRRED